MTRINCIPVEELHDKHLLAEYTEITRVTEYVKKSLNSKTPTAIPSSYRMKEGHVKFFYNKYVWLAERYTQLYNEMCSRDKNVDPKLFEYYLNRFKQKSPFGEVSWKPSVDEITISRQRINERLKEMNK